MHSHSYVLVPLRTGAVAMGLACAAALAADPYQDGHENQGEGAFWISPQDETIALGRQPLYVKRTESFWVHNTRDTAVRIARVDVRADNESAFTINNGCKDLLPPDRNAAST